MLVQIFSDLHLERLSRIPNLIAKCSRLILAGDIGVINTPNYRPFIDIVSQNWDQVVYVPGNHEYYHQGDLLKTKERYQDFFEQYTNVHYLDDQSWYDSEYQVNYLGSTLWSRPNYIQGVNDFKLIRYGDKNLTLDYFYQLHEDAKEFIQQAKKKEFNVTITHFPPIQEVTSHPFYRNNKYSSYFANDLVSSLDGIDVWISGHTHYSYDLVQGKTRLISNQRGYERELPYTGFSTDGLFDLSKV